LSYWPDAKQCRFHGHVCSGKLDDIKPKTCPLEEKKVEKIKKVKKVKKESKGKAKENKGKGK